MSRSYEVGDEFVSDRHVQSGYHVRIISIDYDERATLLFSYGPSAMFTRTYPSYTLSRLIHTGELARVDSVCSELVGII